MVFCLFCSSFPARVYLCWEARPLGFLLTSYHAFTLCLNRFLNSWLFFSQSSSLLCRCFYYRLYISCAVLSSSLRCIAYNVITAVLYAYYYLSFAGPSLWTAECNLWKMTIMLIAPLCCELSSPDGSVGVLIQTTSSCSCTWPLVSRRRLPGSPRMEQRGPPTHLWHLPFELSLREVSPD